MKCFIGILLLLPLFSCSSEAVADNVVSKQDKVKTPVFIGKQLYIPKDLQVMDLTDPESKWSYARMDTTANTVILWEKGFGPSLANPPQLEGTDMSVDLSNLKEKLETDYRMFRDSLKFVKPGSKSEKYRMMVMLNYSLEGTAYGGDYDQTIGALWLAPNRVKDKALNCIAHELGHSFQLQILADGQGMGWGGSGFYEMSAQWMLWQVNPHWMDDENYHWQAYRKQFHKAFLHRDNIYHTAHVVEYWGMKHGRPFIAELFRKGKVGEDPIMTYKELTGMTQSEFCDEMFHADCMQINLDYPRVWSITRSHALQLSTPTETTDGKWIKPAEGFAPENYGFNVIEVTVPKGKNKVKAEFEGLQPTDVTPGQATKAGWRYGFVGVTAEGKTVYGPAFSANKGKAEFTWNKGASMAHVYFVVMGAPTEHWKNPEGGNDAKWNYRVSIGK